MNFKDPSLVSTFDHEYAQTFWNSMRERPVDDRYLTRGRAGNGMYYLPYESMERFQAEKTAGSLFHGIATRMSVKNDHTIFAKDTDHIAGWIPEGEQIPFYDGDEDYSKLPVGYHKLAVMTKFPEDFVHSESFNIEHNLIKAVSKAVNRAEEMAFINGDGVDMPFGILHPERGAEIGVAAQCLTYDDVIKLFFSVKPEYRKNGKWLMNDDTALILRTLKDADGNYLWNQSNDTILGKEVLISEFMPTDGTPIVFGAMDYYWIIDRKDLSVRMLKELFAPEGLIGYLGNEFLDGMLIRREAVKALKLTDTQA